MTKLGDDFPSSWICPQVCGRKQLSGRGREPPVRLAPRLEAMPRIHFARECPQCQPLLSLFLESCEEGSLPSPSQVMTWNLELPPGRRCSP